MLIEYYLILINIVTFFLYASDKYKAKHHKWRIKESVLLGSAFAGGSAGALLAMRIFRHKTRKKVFVYGVPCMLILHITAAVMLFR